MIKKKQITDQQKLFVQNYVANGLDREKAARDAGYKGKPRSLAVTTCNLLQMPHIIEPFFWAGPHFTFSTTERYYEEWEKSCKVAEETYLNMLKLGKASPQEARSVLPNSLKTEFVMTTNLREWRHFFKLRTVEGAHPQMREIAIPLLKEFKQLIPVVFDDIQECLKE